MPAPRPFRLATAALLLAAAQPGPAGAEGDPARGGELAQTHCARCHDISPGGAMKQTPPAFAAIAAYRAPDDILGRIWYPPLHVNMPPWTQFLTREDVADLLAYIVSLEK